MTPTDFGHFYCESVRRFEDFDLYVKMCGGILDLRTDRPTVILLTLTKKFPLIINIASYLLIWSIYSLSDACGSCGAALLVGLANEIRSLLSSLVGLASDDL